MIIPKTYTQFGRTIKVRPGTTGDLCAYNGSASPDRNLIVLDKELERGILEHVYIHEALHIMMNLMSRQDLYTDENFINVLSGLIHQMLHTGKGEI
jgi:hypothetical protein